MAELPHYESATDSESEGNGLEGHDGAAPNQRGEGAMCANAK